MLGARRLTPVGYCSDVRQMPVYIVRVSSGNVTLTPASATLTVTGATPTVTADNNVNVSPSLVALTFTGATPTVTATNYSTTTLTPLAAALVLTGATPTVTGLETPVTADAHYTINSRSARYPVITDRRITVSSSRRFKVNFSNAANRLQTGLSSASWSLQRGSGLVSVGSTLVSGDSAYATITAQSDITGRCVVKVTATMADGQTVTEHIRLTVIKVDA